MWFFWLSTDRKPFKCDPGEALEKGYTVGIQSTFHSVGHVYPYIEICETCSNLFPTQHIPTQKICSALSYSSHSTLAILPNVNQELLSFSQGVLYSLILGFTMASSKFPCSVMKSWESGRILCAYCIYTVNSTLQMILHCSLCTSLPRVLFEYTRQQKTCVLASEWCTSR